MLSQTVHDAHITALYPLCNIFINLWPPYTLSSALYTLACTLMSPMYSVKLFGLHIVGNDNPVPAHQ